MVTWRKPNARCSGASTMVSGMATQLGLATMPWCPSSVDAFTAGTTNGTPGSRRYALDLSTAQPPPAATSGACRREVSAPAAKNATSTPASVSALTARTVSSRPFHGITRPRLRSLASRRSSACRNPRSSSTRSTVPPAAPLAPTTATTGAEVFMASGGAAGAGAGRLLLPLGQLADGLTARQVEAPALVDLDHLDHDLVADVHDILDLIHPVLGQLADAHQPLLLGQDLDEGPEGHQPGHLALVDLADLEIVGEVVDHGDRLLARRSVGRGDEHAPVVLDVDLRAGLLDDLADDLAAWADDVADLVGVDLDDVDARRPRAHVDARRRQGLAHLAEDVQPAQARLLQRPLEQLPAQPGDLHV